MNLSEKKVPREHYVYQYNREDGSPYYIGKGKKKRAFDSHGKIPVPIDKSRIVFLVINLTDDEAMIEERRLIAFYGRKDNGTGILRNMTNGGDGPEGMVMSEATKRKISAALSGGKMPPFSKEHLEKLANAKHRSRGNNTGNKHSEETKSLISKAKIGQKYGPSSEEKKRKLSLVLSNKPHSKEHTDAAARGHLKKCTIDNITIFESKTELIKHLGQGKTGSRSPNFKFITGD